MPLRSTSASLEPIIGGERTTHPRRAVPSAGPLPNEHLQWLRCLALAAPSGHKGPPHWDPLIQEKLPKRPLELDLAVLLAAEAPRRW